MSRRRRTGTEQSGRNCGVRRYSSKHISKHYHSVRSVTEWHMRVPIVDPRACEPRADGQDRVRGQLRVAQARGGDVQWWSILSTQRLHLRQWCVRGGLKAAILPPAWSASALALDRPRVQIGPCACARDRSLPNSPPPPPSARMASQTHLCKFGSVSARPSAA